MPLIDPSGFSPVAWLRNPHLQTVLPVFIRRYPRDIFTRSRVSTWDDDFLDLDWARCGSSRLVILSHGLEGSTRSVYIVRMARLLQAAGFDVLAWNFRGCSGEPNRLLHWYHSGKSEDLDFVLRHARAQGGYEHIALVGFSVGGNITLKWLGEQGPRAPELVSAAVTISVPCDLGASAAALDQQKNSFYLERFLRSMRAKVREKARRFPGRLTVAGLNDVHTFEEFDARYTAPLNGFSSAAEYWRRAGSLPVVSQVQVPTLLVSALDDPFLTPSCFPREVAASHPSLFLETPAHGGHVGFIGPTLGHSWMEERTLAFLREVLG